MNDSQPPGSKKARDEGCTCPPVDNNHGAGRFYDGEEYVRRTDCPLHGF